MIADNRTETTRTPLGPRLEDRPTHDELKTHNEHNAREAMEDHYCIKNALKDPRCDNCQEHHCTNGLEYCVVLVEIWAEKMVLRCPDCGTFRRLTEMDRMAAINPCYKIVCRECGKTWDYDDMTVKIDPEDD